MSTPHDVPRVQTKYVRILVGCAVALSILTIKWDDLLVYLRKQQKWILKVDEISYAVISKDSGNQVSRILVFHYASIIQKEYF